jgi:hypothetical protein
MLPNDLQRYQWHVLEHLKNSIENGTAPPSDGESAIQSLEVINSIFSDLKTGRQL